MHGGLFVLSCWARQIQKFLSDSNSQNQWALGVIGDIKELRESLTEHDMIDAAAEHVLQGCGKKHTTANDKQIVVLAVKLAHANASYALQAIVAAKIKACAKNAQVGFYLWGNANSKFRKKRSWWLTSWTKYKSSLLDRLRLRKTGWISWPECQGGNSIWKRRPVFHSDDYAKLSRHVILRLLRQWTECDKWKHSRHIFS